VVKQNKRAGPPSALKLDDSELGTITILVTPVNDAPNAVDQTVEVNKGESVEITLTGDDGDEDEEQTLIYILKSLPSPGTLTQDGEQSPILNQQLPLVLNSVNLNYSAETSHAGPINFFYVVEDTGGVENGGQNTSAPGEIIINVNPVNAAPMAEAQNVDVDEDKEVEIILSATYADTQPNELLHYFVTALPAHGVLSKSSGGTAIKDSDLPIQLDADRLNYLPNPDYFGNDNFTFKATNNGSTDQGDIDESSAAQITINVSPINDLPRFTIEKPEDLMEDFGTITISIIPDAVPTNEQEQTVTYSVEPSSSALIEYSLDTTPPKLNLHSIEAKSGTVTLNIVADDGLGKFTVENFTITVSAPNDEPIAKSQSLETHENTPLVITLVTHDGDEDIQALSYYLSSLPNQGTLSETADGHAITFDVLPFPLNSSSLYYHPNLHTHGNDGFEFYVTDDGDTEENGVLQSSVAQITITVVSIDAPL